MVVGLLFLGVYRFVAIVFLGIPLLPFGLSFLLVDLYHFFVVFGPMPTGNDGRCAPRT